jgi:hypothetical protein
MNMQNHYFVLVLRLICFPEGTAHTEVVIEENYLLTLECHLICHHEGQHRVKILQNKIPRGLFVLSGIAGYKQRKLHKGEIKHL